MLSLPKLGPERWPSSRPIITYDDVPLSKCKMFYSLRSLMTFSIRDLFWITVVVAMGVAWWLDRNALAVRLVDVEKRLAPLEEEYRLFYEARERKERPSKEFAEQLRQEYGLSPLEVEIPDTPTSSARAPNPPKE